MAYTPFSMTLQSLDRLGSTVTAANALETERKRMTQDHESNLMRLGIQKQQIEGQNRLALANAELSARDRAESRADRAKQLEISKGHLTLAQDREKADVEREQRAEAEKKWMNEGGSVESLWRGSMAKQGLAPEQIDATIQKFANSDPYGYSRQILTQPTIRQKMFDLMDDLPNMIRAEAAARRAAGQTDSASSKVYAGMVKQYQAMAKYLTDNGIGPETAMGRSLLAKAKKDGVDLKHEVVEDVRDVVDPSGSGETIKQAYKKPVWQAQSYDPDTDISMFKENKFKALHDKNPWLTHVDFDTAEEAMNNIVLHPEQEGVIMNGLYRTYFKDQGAPGAVRYNPKGAAKQGQPDLSRQGGGVQGATAPGGVDLAGMAGTSGGVPKLAWDAAKGVWRGLTAAEMAYRSGAGTVAGKAGELRNQAFPDLPQGGGEVFVKDPATGKLRAATSQEAQPRSFLSQDERAWAESAVAPTINTLGAMLSVPTTMPIGALPTRGIQWTQPIQTARTVGSPTMQANTFLRNQRLTAGSQAQQAVFADLEQAALRPGGVSDAARLPRLPKYAGERFTSGAEYPRSAMGSAAVTPSTPNWTIYRGPAPAPRMVSGSNQLGLPPHEVDWRYYNGPAPALPQGSPVQQLPAHVYGYAPPNPVEMGLRLPTEEMQYLNDYVNAQRAAAQARNTFIPFE